MAETGGNSKGGKSWLKYGCFGCLGLGGFVVLIVVGVVGMAMLGARSEEIQERVLTPDVPVTAVAPGPAAGEGVESAPDRLPADRLADLSGDTVVRAGMGKVVLDLSGAEFEVVPGRPGEPLHVEATYDKNSYVLEESLETGDDDSWEYGITFRSKGGGLFALLKQMMGGTQPHVRIVLPVDVPMALDVQMMRGGMEMDVGGLWLQTADLDLKQGGFEFEVSEPLRAPMERLTITGSMGGFGASRLGNASPKVMEVDFSMGGMMLDLRGQWRVDADISIHTSRSGGLVRLPTDVGIEGLVGRGLRVDPTSETRPPILRFTVSSSGGGDLEFR